MSDKTNRRIKIKAHIRTKITGTAERPRLSVYRSLLSMYGQLIDDTKSVTLAGVSSTGTLTTTADAGDRKGKTKLAYLLGHEIALKAKEKNITHVVFDRGGFTYHGRIAAFADGARDGGLTF